MRIIRITVLFIMLLPALWQPCSSQRAGNSKADTAKVPGNNTAMYPGPHGTATLNWSFAGMPAMRNDHHVTGKVVIDIAIDTKGNIVKASINSKHTTIKDSTLIKQCETAVKKSKFTAYGVAESTQTGQITLRFSAD
jgi:hypothetical protein